MTETNPTHFMQAETLFILRKLNAYAHVQSWDQDMGLTALYHLLPGARIQKDDQDIITKDSSWIFGVARQDERLPTAQLARVVEQVYEKKDRLQLLLQRPDVEAELTTTVWFAPEPTLLKELEKGWSYPPLELEPALLEKIAELGVSFVVDMKLDPLLV